MRIRAFEWGEAIVTHIVRHGVNPEEVEEACANRPYVLKGRGGRYLAYSQTSDGRYLFVVLRYRGRGLIRVVTARDMTDAEKSFCQKRR